MKMIKRTWGSRQYETNPEFKLLMDKVHDSYEEILKAAKKAHLKKIQGPKVIQRIENDKNGNRVYCFYGLFVQPSADSAEDFYFNFIRIFEKELSQMEARFSIVFFNTLCESYRTFLRFKQMMKTLPIKFYNRLDRLVIVHPSFAVRSIQWLSFGALNYLLYQHFVFANSLNQLETTGLISRKAIERLPKQILMADRNPNCQDIEMISLERIVLKRRLSERNDIIGLSFQEYEMSEIGVPTLLKMLLSYFIFKPEALKAEGLFRKNADVELLDELELECRARNYDFLNKVSDPHIICGLIKKIFFHSKQPLFSYQTYDFVRAQNNMENLELASLIVQQLPKIKYRTFQFIISFFKYKLIPMQAFNKMNEYNISVVFSPCIFRPKDYKIDDLMSSAKFSKLLLFIITHFEKLFGDAQQQTVIFRKSADEQNETIRNSIMVKLCGKKYDPSHSIKIEEILDFN